MATDTAIESEPEPDGDLLYGVPYIAEFLGLNLRSARSLCETFQVPTFKVGARVCSRRSWLREWLDQQVPRTAPDK